MTRPFLVTDTPYLATGAASNRQRAATYGNVTYSNSAAKTLAGWPFCVAVPAAVPPLLRMAT